MAWQLGTERVLQLNDFFCSVRGWWLVTGSGIEKADASRNHKIRIYRRSSKQSANTDDGGVFTRVLGVIENRTAVTLFRCLAAMPPEGWDTARLPKPRQEQLKCLGWVGTTDLATSDFMLKPLRYLELWPYYEDKKRTGKGFSAGLLQLFRGVYISRHSFKQSGWKLTTRIHLTPISSISNQVQWGSCGSYRRRWVAPTAPKRFVISFIPLREARGWPPVCFCHSEF
ncbi:hypothetical protein CSKR_113879, partial [Clonorchis sinensis]